MKQLKPEELIEKGDCMVTTSKKDRPIPCHFSIGMKAGDLMSFSHGEVIKVIREAE